MCIEEIDGVTPCEDMPGINDHDWKRIDARIAAASALLSDKITTEVALLRARGWEKALHLLREWSVLGVTATVIIALLGIVVALVIAVSNRREADAIFRTNTSNSLEKTNERLTRIETSLLALRGKAVVSSPPDSENQAEAKSVLATSKTESIPLPALVIEQGGQKFIEAAKNDPEAWDVALDFMGYRSSLNAASRLNIPVESKPHVMDTTHYNLLGVSGKPIPQIFASRANGPDTAHSARWDVIGQDENKGKNALPVWLFAKGGATNIDGGQIRNVVFDGTEIHYSGAPVILENVVFINCVFVFDNNERGRELGRALLAAAAVTFQAPT